MLLLITYNSTSELQNNLNNLNKMFEEEEGGC